MQENHRVVEKIVARLNESGRADLVERLNKELQGSLRLVTERASLESLSIGQSRIGGFPDLPPTVKWPARNGRPLSFLAQINLFEAAGNVENCGLPNSGGIALFFDNDEQPWGFDPKDADAWKVIYCPSDTDLVRVDPPKSPLSKVHSFDCCKVSFVLEDTHPGPGLADRISMELADEDEERLCEIEDEVLGEEGMRVLHRLYGYPDQVQGGMEYICQAASHGIYCGTPGWDRDSRCSKVFSEENCLDWILLLQLDSDENPGMMWGDCGRLYVWVPEADLLQLNFDRAWVCLECY